MSFLSLVNINKSYSGRHVVHNLNLDIEKGEFISLLGPSGCGKTTTLQMIAGFVDVTRGSIYLDQRDITQTHPNARGLGIVFQSYALFPHMTVAENVMFGLEMRKVSKTEQTEKTRRILKLVHLDQYAERYPRHLSGGQRQRVALARALVIEPAVLLLDEPLSNLDAKLREEMQFELKRIQGSIGTTTLMVTHDQHEAMSISDRVVVMQDGQIEQDDTPVRLYEQPRSSFVSAFVGKSNLLSAHIDHVGETTTLTLAGGQSLMLGYPAKFRSDTDVLLSLRPEKIHLVAPQLGRLQGILHNRFFMGSHWLYQLDTAFGMIEVLGQNDSGRLLQPGDRTGLDWADIDCRLLPTRRMASEGVC